MYSQSAQQRARAKGGEHKVAFSPIRRPQLPQSLLAPTPPPGVSRANVEAMLAALASSQRQEMVVMAESTAKAVYDQLGPVLAALQKGQQQAKAKTDAMHVEASLDAAAKRDAIAAKADMAAAEATKNAHGYETGGWGSMHILVNDSNIIMPTRPQSYASEP